jgi:hypothetical protein
MNQLHSQKNPENSNLRPPYPPVITAQDLIPTDVSNKVESVRIPNAFIAYRMALVRELKSKKVACHRSNVSSLASRLWAEEPEDVKNTYRKMATDAQMLHNQARGLTFLSYEQSTSTDNVMQEETSSEIINHPSPQEIEAELLALFNLQIQSPLQQQENQMIASPMYFGGNNPTNISSSSASSPYDQPNNNLGNSLNGNFLGNMTGKGMYDGRNLEHRVQILEQQIALFYQLWFGNYAVA